MNREQGLKSLSIIFWNHSINFIFVGIHQPSTSKTVMPSVSQAMFSLDPTHWMNRCIFECKICSLRFDARANFKGHIQGEMFVWKSIMPFLIYLFIFSYSCQQFWDLCSWFWGSNVSFEPALLFNVSRVGDLWRWRHLGPP